MDPEVQLTARQVAEQVGVDTRTVRRWIKDGKLAAEKDIKGQYTVRPSDLDAYLRQREQQEEDTAVVPVPSADILTIMGRIEQLSSDLATERAARQRAEEERDDLKMHLAHATQPLALPETTTPWYRRLFFWKETHTHANDTSPTPPSDEGA